MGDNDEYQAGLRDGRLESLEKIVRDQKQSIDHLYDRLQTQERITYGLLGAVALLQMLPIINKVLG